MKKNLKIFVAYPFSGILNEDKDLIFDGNKNFLIEFREQLINKGHYVFMAHYREHWGKQLMTPDECTLDDLKEMVCTDLVVAFPGPPFSGGVHIELGWASSFKKRIILMLKEGEDYSPLILGLGTVCDASIYYYKKQNVEEVIQLIEQLVLEL